MSEDEVYAKTKRIEIQCHGCLVSIDKLDIYRSKLADAEKKLGIAVEALRLFAEHQPREDAGIIEKAFNESYAKEAKEALAKIRGEAGG